MSKLQTVQLLESYFSIGATLAKAACFTGAASCLGNWVWAKWGKSWLLRRSTARADFGLSYPRPTASTNPGLSHPRYSLRPRRQPPTGSFPDAVVETAQNLGSVLSETRKQARIPSCSKGTATPALLYSRFATPGRRQLPADADLDVIVDVAEKLGSLTVTDLPEEVSEDAPPLPPLVRKVNPNLAPLRSCVGTGRKSKGKGKAVSFDLERNETVEVENWFITAIHKHVKKRLRFSDHAWTMDVARWIEPDGHNQISFPRTKWIWAKSEWSREDEAGDVMMEDEVSDVAMEDEVGDLIMEDA